MGGGELAGVLGAAFDSFAALGCEIRLERLRADDPALGHAVEAGEFTRGRGLLQPREVGEVAVPARRGVGPGAGVLQCGARVVPRGALSGMQHPAQAGPRPLGEGFDPAQARAHGIETNVVAESGKGLAALDQEALVPALEEMALLAPEAIEARRERALQPLHSRDEIGVRGLEREVVMIGHQRPRMDAPT